MHSSFPALVKQISERALLELDCLIYSLITLDEMSVLVTKP